MGHASSRLTFSLKKLPPPPPPPPGVLSPYSTGNWVCVGHQTQMKSTQKKHEMYMANAKILRLEPNVTYIPLTRVVVLRWVKRKICVTQQKRYRHVSFALGNAKVWRWGSKPTPAPNANGLRRSGIYALLLPNGNLKLRI